MYFKKTSHINLKAPMQGCLPTHSRSIVHQGDVRFKDHMKEASTYTDKAQNTQLIALRLILEFTIFEPHG